MKIVFSLHLVLAIVCMESRLVSMVRIKMDTLEMKGWELNAANISCLAENLEWPAKQIVSIQLLGPGNTIIANLDHDSNISKAKDLYLAKTEVHGKMEKEIWRSYLTVTMYDILTSHSGMYTCNLYFYDQQGFVREDIASNNLDAGKQDMGQVIMYMMSRIASLEEENRKKNEELEVLNKKVALQTSEASTMKMRDQELQTLIVNQSVILDGLTERYNFMTAFSAGYSDNSFKQGDVVLFNKMHFQVGDGYNTNTGMYKAPRAGFYIFNLIVVYHGSSALRINIVANDKPVAETYTVDGSYWRQSSVSAIVKLEVGDVVKPVAKYASGTRYINIGYPFTSEFIGYILKAL